MTNLHEIHHVANFSVAYLLRKSHVELVRDAEMFGNPIPSLRMQVMKINQDSCRFRGAFINHVDMIRGRGAYQMSILLQ